MRLALLSLLCVGATLAQQTHNQLTPEEQNQGWILLLDGATIRDWQDPRSLTPPGDGWTITDNWITTNPKPRITEDLLSSNFYGDFELAWDWQIAGGGNSGVKYRVQKTLVLCSATKKPDATRFGEQVQYALVNKSFVRSLIPAEGDAQTATPAMLKQALAHRWGADSEVFKPLAGQPGKDCVITLQNHGNEAWFHDVKIRRI